MNASYSSKDLRNYSFKGRNLENFDFSNTDIRGCDFSNARLKNSNFTDIKTGHTTRQIIFTLAFNILVLTTIILIVLYASFLVVSLLISIFNINIKSEEVSSISNWLTGFLVVFICPGLLYWLGNRFWWGLQLSAIEIIFSFLGYIIWLVCVELIPNILKQGKYFGVSFYIVFIFALILMMFTLLYLAIQLIKQKTPGTSFKNADLAFANFQNSQVHDVDFSNAFLYHSNWKNTKFTDCKFEDSILKDIKVRNLLTSRDGSAKSYKSMDLRSLNLTGVNLEDADLTESNLSDSNFHGSNLQGANLSSIQALGTDFSECKLTKAILDKEWSIDSRTNLGEIECQYIYINTNLVKERFPRGRRFDPGEFTTFFKQSITTVELLFEDGVEWAPFFNALWELKNEDKYKQDEITFQGYEDKGNGVVIIRVNTPPNVEKSGLKDFFWKKYEETMLDHSKLVKYNQEVLEDVREALKCLPESISESIKIEVEKSMSNQPKYSINAHEVRIFDNVETFIENQYAQSQNLPEAAKDIQKILKELSVNYKNDDLVIQFDQEVSRNKQIQDTLIAGGLEVIKQLCGPLGIPIEMGRKWLETAKENKSK